MDAVFQLEEGARSNFVLNVMQTLGSSYACLWSFLSPSSCLFFLDGLCQEEGNTQSNALFDQYKQSLFIIQPTHGLVPGLAFGNNTPYIEAREDQLLTIASNSIQRQFYQEARIKVAVFMGCRSGEIEIGFSNAPPVDMEMQMMSLLPDTFTRQLPLGDILIPVAENPNPRPSSSSSSSLRSLVSIDSHSPQYSSLLFNLYSTAAAPSSSSQPLLLTTPSAIPATAEITFPEQLPQCPTTESETAAMTSAFLAVMTSPSLFSTSNELQPHPQLPQQQHPPPENPRPSAFARYTTARFKPSRSRRHSMLKRAIAYCRGMNLIRLHESLQVAGIGGAGSSGSSGRPISSTQMHHMISERKRREKLNESYQSLKALLPPGTKKYKASVLAATREYLTSLRSQVETLRRRNAVLKAQLLPPPSQEAPATAADESATSTSLGQNASRAVEVSSRTISDSASTSSQDRTVDLRVTVRLDVPLLDLVTHILEFLNRVRNVNVLSIAADTRVTQLNGLEYQLLLRLYIEGEEWVEAAFEEAVRRVVADFSQ